MPSSSEATAAFVSPPGHRYSSAAERCGAALSFPPGVGLGLNFPHQVPPHSHQGAEVGLLCLSLSSCFPHFLSIQLVSQAHSLLLPFTLPPKPPRLSSGSGSAAAPLLPTLPAETSPLTPVPCLSDVLNILAVSLPARCGGADHIREVSEHEAHTWH